MRWYYKWRSRLTSLFKRSSKDDELSLEIEQHVELVAAEYEAEGLAPNVARKKALKEFGNVEALKEECRDNWGMRVVADLMRDFRYSARSLWKSKGFAVSVIMTLGLCIGANTTVFSVLYGLVLRSLPFESSDRIVQIFWEDDLYPMEGSMISWNQYVEYRKHPHLFEAVAISDPDSKIYGSEDVVGRKVTPDYFEVMQVRPVAGRFFTQEESEPGSDRVLVLSNTAWEKYFDSDPNILGEEIQFLNEASYTIIGVAPRSLEIFDSNNCYFVPWIVSKFWKDPQQRMGWTRSDFWARLAPGVTHNALILELNEIERRWLDEVATVENRKRYEKSHLRFAIDRPHPLKNRLILLQAGALLVLLVGCANIVNLMLSRANGRIHELFSRHAMGAGKTVLARIMLVESFMLATSGGILAQLLAWSSLGIINRYLQVLFPKGQPVLLTETTFIWTFLLMVVVTVTMGLIPILLFLKLRLFQTRDPYASASRGSRSISSGLVICQVATTFALLVSTGLLIRSFYNVLSVDPGFEAAQVIKGKIQMRNLFGEKESASAVSRIKDSVREIAGVKHVGLIESNTDTLGKNVRTSMVSIRGIQEPVLAVVRFVDEEFFSAMGIELKSGNILYSGDETHKIRTRIRTSYIVDETFANRYLKGPNAIGSQILRGSDPPVSEDGWLSVEAVAKRVTFEGLEGRDGLPVLYVCRDQAPWAECNLLFRTNRSLVSLIPEVRTKLKEVDPRLFLSNPTTMDVELNKLHYDRQGLTLLAVVLGGLTLGISAVGIYGVLSYDAHQRRREIGIRSALGATRSNVLVMILGQGFLKAGIGLFFGLIGSWFLNRFLESRLFDVSILDPATYITVTSVILLVTLFASYLPARRALQINPVEALRAE